jgi:hypothetical protein
VRAAAAAKANAAFDAFVFVDHKRVAGVGQDRADRAIELAPPAAVASCRINPHDAATGQ